MTHGELCFATAQRFVDKVALYEYKSFASQEEPDVLVYGYTNTVLYEIKMSRSDFFADKKKEARKKYRSGGDWYLTRLDQPEVKPELRRAYVRFRSWNPELFCIQAPHLGSKRYYVCEWGLLKPDEIPECWGLYWYRAGKFYQKKDSKNFRVNMRDERDLMVHALRRYASGDHTGILVNTY